VTERVRKGTGKVVDALADDVLAGAISPAEAARRLIEE
jgi:hypothetical protein